ncbi:hypothetical protein N7495_009933 [Penicillium taxi]|uniref:uncharacterized protein n=1 Tax=Penicillium taxi TaxID=168475 RepID=UPI0025459D44|nr:uncharacterized protein N7495_009933 [Penicillium taxi]KAJ5885423.1 hypothetical protein N7495_009933 [Penicillium taxi]
MAELVGAIASGITLVTAVVQVGQSILTLKEWLDEVHNAPEDLRSLVRELELFSLVLGDIEADLQQQSLVSALTHSKHAEQSYRFCREAADHLDGVCQELLKELRPSGNANRKDSLSSEPSVSTLRKEESIQTRKSRYLWRLSLPSWISSQIFELAGTQTGDGWKWQFRSYNEIQEDSKVVQYAETGDLKGLQELFASRQASPFDRVSTTGYSLLFSKGQTRAFKAKEKLSLTQPFGI